MMIPFQFGKTIFHLFFKALFLLLFIYCSSCFIPRADWMTMLITADQYLVVIQKFFNEKLKQFQEAGGWDVVNEKAQHFTYNRYLETGTEDCENTARLIESLMVTLKTVKYEMQAEVECLEARMFGRTNFTKMIEIIDNATEKIRGISENCTEITSSDKNLTKGVNQALPLMDVLNFSEVQIEASTSKNNQNNAFRQVLEKSTRIPVEKLYRPQASLTGSFTEDQDEDSVTFLEPMHVLTFQDTTIDETARDKDNLDEITNSSVNESVGTVSIPGPPVMKSELAKRWIREVSKKMF